MKVTTVGLDIAKDVFQVYGVDANGQVVAKNRLARNKLLDWFGKVGSALVGMEACGSAHHWARELSKQGHEVRLISPQFVRPFRKGCKNDPNDAEAIYEALSRPSMRFVSIKTIDEQAVLAVHRVRERLVAKRTALINQIRSLLAEFGVLLPNGAAQVRRTVSEALEVNATRLPALLREIVADLREELEATEDRLREYEGRIDRIFQGTAMCKKLAALEGVGPVTATALVASVGRPDDFKNGRQFAAWLGLTPRQHSSGGRQCLMGITKRGDRYLRTLLIHGARSALNAGRRKTDSKSLWAERLRLRRGNNIAATALAAKNARILWALMTRADEYRLST
jgi:transposase